MNKDIALVTGGNQGLGYEFCRQLGTRGYNVLLTSRDAGKGEKAAAELRSQGFSVTFFPLSVDREDDIKKTADFVSHEYGKVDLIINNAGVNPNSNGFNFDQNVYLDKLDPEEFLTMVRINSLAPILMMKHFAHLLARSKVPKVVNISSWMGSIGNRKKGNNYSYCASKAALNMMVRLSGFDLKERNIVSICVNPGSVKTRMGGENAMFSVEQSVAHIFAIIDKVTIADSGKFFNWDGTVHEW